MEQPEQSETFDRRMSGVSSFHYLRLIEERGDVGFWASDFANDRVTASIGAYRILGLDPTKPTSYADMIRLMHPEDRPLHQDLQGIVRSGQPVCREYRIIRPDGTIRWVRNRAEVIMDGRGQPVKAVGFLMDTTETHHSRRTAAEATHRYHTLVNSVATMEWLANERGMVEYNEAWRRLTGQTPEEARNNGWLTRIHPRDRERSAQRWFNAVEQRAQFAHELNILCVDETYRKFHVRAAPVPAMGAEPVTWIGFLVEIGVYDYSEEANRECNLPTPGLVRAARAFLGWGYRELSAHSGISLASVRRIETGEMNPVRDCYLKIFRHTFAQHGVKFRRDGGMATLMLSDEQTQREICKIEFTGEEPVARPKRQKTTKAAQTSNIHSQ